MISLNDVFAETEYLISNTKDRSINDNKQRIRSWWFVTAHTINGGRFYSEPFDLFEDACDYFDNIKSLVNYFDGGYVEMLRVNNFDYDVVAICRI